MLTPAQIIQVRSLWTAIEPLSAEFTDLIYEELFIAEPQLRLLFEGAMDEQHLKLAALLQKAVGMLNAPDEFDQLLSELGKKHKQYGVRPYHFTALGTAWMRALDRIEVNKSPEQKDAWEAFYKYMAGTMQAGIAIEV